MRKIKIEKKNIFHRQLLFWKETFMAALIGSSLIVYSFYNDVNEISFFILYSGYFFVSLAVLFFLMLLIEIIRPKENLMQGKFQRMKRIFSPIGIVGYKLFFVRKNRVVRFYISINKRDSDLTTKLTNLLENNETYRIKYLTKSKTIFQIDNNTSPEIEEIIRR